MSVLMILFNMLHSEQCLALSRCSNHIFNELSEQMNKISVMLIRNMNILKEGHRKYFFSNIQLFILKRRWSDRNFKRPLVDNAKQT